MAIIATTLGIVALGIVAYVWHTNVEAKANAAAAAKAKAKAKADADADADAMIKVTEADAKVKAQAIVMAVVDAVAEAHVKEEVVVAAKAATTRSNAHKDVIDKTVIVAILFFLASLASLIGYMAWRLVFSSFMQRLAPPTHSTNSTNNQELSPFQIRVMSYSRSRRIRPELEAYIATMRENDKAKRLQANSEAMIRYNDHQRIKPELQAYLADKLANRLKQERLQANADALHKSEVEVAVQDVVWQAAEADRKKVEDDRAAATRKRNDNVERKARLKKEKMDFL